MQKVYGTTHLDLYTLDVSTEIELPLVSDSIPAGIPAPVDNFIEDTLDLNKQLILHPSATFLAKAKGTSMQDAGIYEGDIMIVDKAVEPGNNCIAVCTIDSEFTVKRINKIGEKLFLMPANKAFKPIEISEYANFIIWGIVTYVIHKPK